jgi:hypothetical protein
LVPSGLISKIAWKSAGFVVKQRSGLGYEALCREVSDSLHLRRFLPDPLAWLSLLTSASPGTTNPPRPSTAS